MKIKNWAFILFLMVLFTGCTTKVSQDESSVTNNEDVVSSENVSQGSDEATETVDNSPKLYVDMKDVFLYQVAEGGIVSEKRTTKFDSKEYKSNTAVSQKSYTYKNKALDLKYLKSSTVSKSDKTVDVYDFGGENNEWIIFEGDSNTLVKLVNFTFDRSMSSEKESIELINELAWKNIDLSEYEYYSVETHMYFLTETHMRSTTVDGFYIPKNENEILRERSFYFNKCINGIKTNDHIYATFYNGKYTMEIYSFDYKESDFDFKKIDEAQKSLEAIAALYMKSNYEVKTVDVIDQVLFIQDGKSFIQFTTDISFSDINASNNEAILSTRIVFMIDVTPSE